MKIEILGTGCPKCKELGKRVKRAVDELKIRAEIIKIENIDEIIEKGIMLTPALVIDGETVVNGNVPSVEEIIWHISKNKK